tara:strand:- start:21 stop:1415 length:1395 start_codon:yes stop_codon:yes gene_type:complete
MIPVIALVGRPNVGKSTLFNRLTRSQDAIVADFPGLTRDRQYGDAIYDDKPFIVIDTGGVGVDDIAVDELMSKQSHQALEEADIVFFMVDARDGVLPVDQEIAMTLRKLDKPVHLIINKIDGINEDVAQAEFLKFGFSSVHPISASHGRGINSLLTDITAHFPPQQEHDLLKDNAIDIAFIGRPNVGKSTLINRMLGEERVVVYDMPGTTRDSISIPFEHDEQKYVLVDTAGVRRRGRIDEKVEKFSIVKTIQSVKQSHVCLLLIDGKEGLTDQDLHLLGFIIESGKAVVILVNKWDGLEHDHKEHIKTELDRRLQFAKFAKVRFISALHGTGVGHLYKDIQQAYKSAMQQLSTPKLTKLLEEFVSQHMPPSVQGRRIKLRYAHAGGHNPPIIVIHGNQLNALPESYIRYLTNAYTSALGLIGTPLKIELKSGQNPFKGRKNQLTERQKIRRKRLIRHLKKNKR